MIGGIKNFFYELFSDQAQSSLLSKQESTAIKGFLIILIVLGHNKYLMQGGFSNRFLYSFHIYDFYFLPFLYNFSYKPLKKLLATNIKRFYIPYTVFFCILTALCFVTGVLPNISSLAQAYVCGTQYTLGQAFGFGSFLWFIPTMFSLLMFRWIYYMCNVRLRMLMFILSALCLCGFAYMWGWSVLLWWHSPISLFLGFAMLAPALVCRHLYSKNLDKPIIEILFFILVLAILIVYPLDYPNIYLTINRLICPTLIFLFILTFVDKLKNIDIIGKLGALSFQIYLIHIFIYNGFYIFIDKYNMGNLYIGFLMFIVTLTTSYFIAKIPVLKYIFPK